MEILEKIVVSSYDQIVWENLLETRKTGIPIGNLTSQLFANIYLNELDQFVKHQLKIRHYLRYMDDFLFLGGDKKELRKIKEKVEIFLRESLRLHFHPKKANLFPVKNGIDFLGYRVFYPTLVKLRKKTVQRFCGKMKQRKKSGDAKKLFQSVQSFLGFAKHARAWGLVGRLGIGVEK